MTRCSLSTSPTAARVASTGNGGDGLKIITESPGDNVIFNSAEGLAGSGIPIARMPFGPTIGDPKSWNVSAS